MKSFKQFLRESKQINEANMSEEEILKWLKKYNIYSAKYTIKNGVVDVKGDISLLRNVQEIPFQFGKIGGFFSCSMSKLKSLKGCPKEVDGDFYCKYISLTSLKGCPKKVGGNFDCSGNFIKSLEGCPKKVGGDFYCDHNSADFTIEDVEKLCDVKGEIKL